MGHGRTTLMGTILRKLVTDNDNNFITSVNLELCNEQSDKFTLNHLPKLE